MEEKIFVGYNYGRFKNDEGEMQAYCNVFVLEDFAGEESKDYHYSGHKAVKYSCLSPDLFKDIEVGSTVLVAFNGKKKISYMVPVDKA